MKRFLRQLKIAGGASLLIALVVVIVALAADVNIDSFNAGSNQIIQIFVADADGDDIPDLPVQAVLRRLSTAAIGGERDLILTVNTGNVGDLARWRATTVSGFYLTLALDPNIEADAIVQWDGNGDATGQTLDCTGGLGGVDLTDAGTNEGIVVRVQFSDTTAPLAMRLYTDCSNWEEYTLDFQDDVGTGQVVDLFMPFSSFGGGAGTMNPASIRAIEMEIDTTGYPGADVEVKFIRATSIKEFGDLPTSGAVIFDSAIVDAYHISQGLRLGVNVDAEANDNPDTNAVGDDNQGTPDDEDGVTRDMVDQWTPGATVDLSIVVRGCGDSTTCYLNGWIDWDRSGDFSGANEQIYNDNAVADGTQGRTVSVPASGYTQGDDVYTRFRVCRTLDTCDTPTATNVLDGEIEDYYWLFRPTAVTLTSLQAYAAQPALVGLLAAVTLAASGGLVFLRRRRAK